MHIYFRSRKCVCVCVMQEMRKWIEIVDSCDIFNFLHFLYFRINEMTIIAYNADTDVFSSHTSIIFIRHTAQPCAGSQMATALTMCVYILYAYIWPAQPAYCCRTWTTCDEASEKIMCVAMAVDLNGNYGFRIVILVWMMCTLSTIQPVSLIYYI